MARLPGALAAVAASLALAGLPAASAEEWRVTNAEPVFGTWRVAELELHADERCEERLEVVKESAYAAPLAEGTWKPTLHRGQDCWEPCGAEAGFCNWCGQGAACCKQGDDQDPAECRRAVGFSTGFHECVAVKPDAAGPAFDGDLETSFEVQCPPEGCAAGSIVLGAEVLAPGAKVGCVLVVQPAVHLTTAGGADAPKVKLVASRATHSGPLRGGGDQPSTCPGLCRSGKYVEAITGGYAKAGACRTHVDQRGHCIKATSGPLANGIDCRGCRSRPATTWEEDAMPAAERTERFGGAFTSVRLQHTHIGSAAGAKAGDRAPLVLPAWLVASTFVASWGAGLLGLFTIYLYYRRPTLDWRPPKSIRDEEGRVDLLRSSRLALSNGHEPPKSIILQKEAKLQILS